MNKIKIAKQLIKLAKNIISRSQMIKTCKIDNDNNCTCYIEQSIFLNHNNYNYAGLKLDIQEFVDDVNRELDDINFGNCDIDDVKLDIDENGLLLLSYQKMKQITEEEKQIIRSHEWRIGNELY